MKAFINEQGFYGRPKFMSGLTCPTYYPYGIMFDLNSWNLKSEFLLTHFSTFLPSIFQGQPSF